MEMSKWVEIQLSQTIIIIISSSNSIYLMELLIHLKNHLIDSLECFHVFQKY